MKKGQSFGIIAPVALAAALAVSLAFIGCAGDAADAGDNDPAGNPALTGTVTITGTAEAGQTLTADTTALGGTGTISYRWKAGTKNISGATNVTYTPAAGDVGKAIKVAVSRAGYSGTVTSAATSAVAAAGSPALTGTVTITGIPEVGETLTADTTALGGTTGAISYRWKADTTDISGATGSTYSPAADDVGKAITVEVSRAGYSGTVTSDPTAPVTAAGAPGDPALTGTVTITGIPEVGETLTAVTTALGGTTGTISYKWKAAAIDITPSATAGTYSPVSGDIGKTITVEVSRAGYSGTVTGGPTAAVTAAPSTPSGTTFWAKSVTDGTGSSSFSAVAKDSSGNMYAVGTQDGDGPYEYGPGIRATGTASGFTSNAVLVKYNSDGDAQWAKSVTSGSVGTTFSAVAVDNSTGNVYAAGYQSAGTVNYGDGSASVTTAANGVVLVKYDSVTGAAQWAKSVTGSADSYFNAVAVDSSGNVYAAGYQRGNSVYDYGSGKTATATGTNGNAMLVKYNPSGLAQWAVCVNVSGGTQSGFASLAVDSTGNVYAAGRQQDTAEYDYGNGVTATGTASGTKMNAVLVKYDSGTGNALWAKTVTAGAESSYFESVALDNAGNLYAAGSQNGTGSNNYGGASAAGAVSGSISSALLVKYDSGTGNALWAKSVTAGSDASIFKSVALDSAGNVYAAGSQKGNGAYIYGASATATGAASGLTNTVLVKYDSGGTAQWAKSVTAGSGTSSFKSVALGNLGGVYAAGDQSGIGSYGYGDGQSATGTAASPNAVLVKYQR